MSTVSKLKVSTLFSRIFGCGCIVLNIAVCEAADYEKVESSIFEQEELLASLAAANSFSDTLIEPLIELAKLQESAGRLIDMQETISQALSVSRINHGLYNEAQLPLLRFEIESDIALLNWESTKEKLEHYTWLLTNQIALPLGTLSESLWWLISTHKYSALQASEDDRAWHIDRAKRLSEALVNITYREDLQHSLPHVQFLYNLTQMYYLEAKAILAGGSASYQLRRSYATVTNVETRSNSQRRLFNAGLNALYRIKNIVEASESFPKEAVGLVELRIADWNALFGYSDDIEADYGLAIASLQGAGISTQSLSELLANPVPIPRPSLFLGVAEELADIQSISSSPTNTSRFQLSLEQASPSVPGVSSEGAGIPLGLNTDDNWLTLKAKLRLEPDVKSVNKNSGFRTKSFVTATDIEILESKGLVAAQLQQSKNQIAQLSFRPAFKGNKPAPSNLILSYKFQNQTPGNQPKLLSAR